MGDLIEQVKAATRLEELIAETVPLSGHGRSMRGARRNVGEYSLVVDVEHQLYNWFVKGEGGDCFNWVMRRDGCDFKGALEILCRRANIEMTGLGHEDMAARTAARKREDVFTIAMGVFEGWLLGDSDALGYVRERGWSDETIAGEHLGYTGIRSRQAELVRELSGALVEQGHMADEPECVALLGYSGDVSAWGKRHEIEVPQNWIENGYIPGLIAQDLLVYPHIINGRVRYFSGRGVHEKRHYNLPRSLVGGRRLFYNRAWRFDAEAVVVVEGQADAVSLGQWGVAAIALAQNKLAEELVEPLRQAVKDKTVYVGLDADEGGDAAAFAAAHGLEVTRDAAGKSCAWQLAKLAGPMARLLRWGADPEFRTYQVSGESKPQKIKDGNDYLRAMVQGELEGSKQTPRVGRLMKGSATYVETVALWVGGLEGASRDEALNETAVPLIAQMAPLYMDFYAKKLATGLGVGVQQLKNALKTYNGQPTKEEDGGPSEIVETVGGWIGEHLLELLYDAEGRETALAVRYADGRVERAERVDIDGVRYIPMMPIPLITESVVLFPSAVVEPRSTKELVAVIKGFIHRYLDVDEFYERLAAYYVLFTWLYDCFTLVPYLRALGDYGTGKTRFIETIGQLCYRPILTAGATSTASIFRLLHQFRGTLILDEADFSQSDESAQIIKIMNVGNKKGGNVLRAQDMGNGNFQAVPYNVFGPKIIATRKKFGDQATESRCLTKEMGGGVPRDDIPIVEPREFYSQAREIRNLLLAYRMQNWRTDIEVDLNGADRSIEPRLNQVTLALKTMIPELELKEEIDQFIRAYNQQLIVERSMTPEAKVLEAIVLIHDGTPGLLSGGADLSFKNIAKKANELMDSENSDEDEDDTREHGGKRLTPKGVGHYLRTKLNLSSERQRDGYYLVWNEDRIGALKRRYGLV